MSSLLALAKLAQAGEHQTGMEEVPSFAKLFAIPNVSLYANIANFVHFEKNSINWLYYRPQRSCGKVISSQVSVSHSVCRGVCIPACTWADTPWVDMPSPGQTPHWADTPGQIPPGQIPPGRPPPLTDTTPGIPPRPPGQIPLVATAADGTHPTGMHFC